MSLSLPILTARSQIEAWQKCPRLAWYEYYCEGRRGLQLGSTMALDIGSAFHCAAEAVLKFIKTSRSEVLLSAHLIAEDRLMTSVLQLALDAAHRAPEWAALTEQDDRDTAEALVRTWWAVGLPQLAGWRVLEVEREEIFDWGEERCSLCEQNIPFDMAQWHRTSGKVGDALGAISECKRGVKVKMMSRLDLLAEALPGATLNGLPVVPGEYVWNWKTAKRCDDRWKQGWGFDAQVLTELLGVEQRLGRKMAGVVIMGIVKENHPLVWCWRHKTDGSTEARFDKQYGGSHPYRWAKGGYCTDESLHTHRLGKDYERVAVRDLPGGTAAYFDKMMRETPDVLADYIVPVGPITRPTDWEIEEWVEENLPREVELAQAASGEPTEAMLRRWFPRRTAHGNCLWPYRCPAFDICRCGAATDDLPLRVPNHAAERERFGLEEK